MGIHQKIKKNAMSTCTHRTIKTKYYMLVFGNMLILAN